MKKLALTAVLAALSLTAVAGSATAIERQSNTKDATTMVSKVKNHYTGEVKTHTDHLYQDVRQAPGRVNNK